MELLRLTGLSNGALEYHLRILEKSDRIKVDRLEGKRPRYYSIDEKWSLMLDVKSNTNTVITRVLRAKVIVTP